MTPEIESLKEIYNTNICTKTCLCGYQLQHCHQHRSN